MYVGKHQSSMIKTNSLSIFKYFILIELATKMRYRTIISALCKSAKAIIIMYDISNQVSFDELDQWLSDLKEHNIERTLVYLVGKIKFLTARKKNCSNSLHIT